MNFSFRKNYKWLLIVFLLITVAVAAMGRAIKIRSLTEIREQGAQSAGASTSGPAKAPKNNTAPIGFSSNEPLAAQIGAAQKELAQAIIDDNVHHEVLAKFYREFRGVGNDAEALRIFPPKTAEGFRKLHALLRRSIEETMRQDGKGPEFFQSPSSKALPKEMVEHALYLEKMPVSGDVAAFVENRAKAPKITDSDIRRLASLCSNQWPCIEKGAYTWIKANHMLSPSQHETLLSLRNGV